MTPLWPCSQCGAPGARNIGAHGYCATHATDLYRQLPVEAWRDGGRGLLNGRHRPDHGPEFHDLQCALCGATWVGTLLEPCGWCQDRIDAQTVAQARLLLNPHLPTGDRSGAIVEWGRRLAVAVETGVISEHDAHQAITRIEGHRDRAA